jgi:hypothetical protein
MTPVSDAQWRAFRQKMEQISEENARHPQRRETGAEELAEMVLLLMDRIDDLERKLSA